MYPTFQNKRYVIKVIIIYVLERKITDLKIRGVKLVGPMLAPKLSAKLDIFSLLSYNCDSFKRLYQENPLIHLTFVIVFFNFLFFGKLSYFL